MTSKIKVDNINKVSDDSNIINKCGTTITLGASGDSVNLASGASQTGFGRTGTVDWETTIQTSTPFTAVSGKGYFINTTSGAITMNLPASPSVGDIVSFKDYARTFDNNALTVGRNGSNMDGAASDTDFATAGLYGTLIYMDASKGWSLLNDDQTSQVGAKYLSASGGNTTITCGNYKTHIFTGPGTFTVSCAGNAAGSDTLEYLVVGGGGATGSPSEGSAYASGGGGGGGYRMYTTAPGCNAPINAPAGVTASASPGSYPISVGAAGSFPSNGGDSIFSTITSTGGGTGARNNSASTPCLAGQPGGSGGGGGGGCGPAGSGNSPPVSPPQGNDAGTGTGAGNTGGGGGGGGTSAGINGGPSVGGKGGTGGYIADSFFGPTAPSYGTSGPVSGTRYFSGGGGGGAGYPGGPGTGGANPDGGGGAGGSGTGCATAATINTGGGGGGGKGGQGAAKNGGSGIVAIRYKFQ